MTSPTASLTTGRQTRWLLTILAVVAVAVGGGYAIYRSVARSMERRAALALAERGQPAEALPALLHSLQKHPDDPELLRAVVTTMSRTGTPGLDIEPYVDHWCQSNPSDPDAFRSRVVLMTQLKRYEDAIQAAERVLELSPVDHITRSKLAGLFLSVGRFSDAAGEYRRLLDTASVPRGDVKVGLARAIWELGNASEAGKLLDEVLAQSPNDTQALILRGIIYYRAGDFQKAVSLLSRARTDSQNQQEIVLYHLGLCFDQLGKPEDSAKAFSLLAAVQTARAYRDDAAQRPDDIAMQVRAAEALLAANQPKIACADIEATLTRHPSERSLLLVLARCYEVLGDPVRARATRDRAALSPK